MKTYQICADITMSVYDFVDASNEEEAKEKVEKLIKEDLYNLINRTGVYVCHEITDISES